MTKIDQLFFQDYFKPNSSYNSSKNINLIYEFSIYHPVKNVKTQQISIQGDGVLKQLKDKIYCVLDEIQGETPSFFFLEKVFYDDFTLTNSNYIEPLSYKISRLKLEKLTLKQYQNEINYNKINEKNENKNVESKFDKYEPNLYLNLYYLIYQIHMKV